MSQEIRDLGLKLERAEEELRRIKQETGVAHALGPMKEGREPPEVRLTTESKPALDQAQRKVDEIKRQIEDEKGQI